MPASSKMRTITLIVIHCSATPQGRSLHRRFKDIGYHFYITRDGLVHAGRPLGQTGAHCRNHNRHSIGICYEGGLDAKAKPKDTRTGPQKTALRELLRQLKDIFPQALVVGHRDLDPMKECPCFDAAREYSDEIN